VVQFVAFDTKVEVSGVSMLSVISAMGERVKPALEKHGMGNLDAEKWYPIQPYLDFYREISENRGYSIDLMKIGMMVPEKATFPPDMVTIQDAFTKLDEAYHLNHRGGDFGHYYASIVSPRQIDVIAHNPFPCDLDYGIVQGLARRFRPAGATVIVYHDAMKQCRKRGADRCTYHITW
jgi:hypothetical protein